VTRISVAFLKPARAVSSRRVHTPPHSPCCPPGLHIIHDLLLPIKKKYPDVSYGDLWALAGAAAVEFAGGPEIPLELGRVDVTEGEFAVTKGTGKCPVPPNGRLPDASQVRTEATMEVGVGAG